MIFTQERHDTVKKAIDEGWSFNYAASLIGVNRGNQKRIMEDYFWLSDLRDYYNETKKRLKMARILKMQNDFKRKGFNKTEVMILDLLSKNRFLSSHDLAYKLGKNQKAIDSVISRLYAKQGIKERYAKGRMKLIERYRVHKALKLSPRA